jgi:hypothetical protein
VGNVLSLKDAATGDPIELGSSECCEDDQMKAGPSRSQQTGSKIL